MGAKKKTTAKFLAEHPICFFCPGDAETIDHVPHRDCFLHRVGPEGYEFPACKKCNNSAGPVEQVVALYLHISKTKGETPEPFLRRLLSGVHNNKPTFMPREMRAVEKRKAMNQYGLTLPAGGVYADMPMIMLPEGSVDAFTKFARRLICALYYKHIGSVVPVSHVIRTAQFQWAKDGTRQLVDELRSMLPNGVRSHRQNTDIGDQFEYIWYGEAESSTFAFAASIATSYVFTGIATGEENSFDDEDYIPHHADFPLVGP